MDVFVRIEDIGHAILDYINSPEFEAAVKMTVDDGRSAFMGGLGMAGCIIMARCPRYYSSEQPKEEV